jgi:hypothetical protein
MSDDRLRPLWNGFDWRGTLLMNDESHLFRAELAAARADVARTAGRA